MPHSGKPPARGTRPEATSDMRTIDLGPCPAVLDEGAQPGCMVLLPGAGYPTRGPLLWFARELAHRRGWTTLEVLDSWQEDDDPFGWARDRAQRALAAAPDERPIVVGKSLASAAAGLVAARHTPAIWLTPLLDQASVIAGLKDAVAPTLLIGGSADASWNRPAVPDNPAIEICELDGLDHDLQPAGRVHHALDALRTVVDRLEAFLSRYADPVPQAAPNRRR
jgi:hypothetical protein